jgi:3-deoxy-D-manno-octulosonic-acid transferase
VSDAESLAKEALGLLTDAPARRLMTSRAEGAIAAMSGALPRTLAALEPYLPPKTTLQHAS